MKVPGREKRRPGLRDAVLEGLAGGLTNPSRQQGRRARKQQYPTVSGSRRLYAEVGAAHRAVIARAASLGKHMGELDWRVLPAVLVLTASWSKLDDETSTRQLAAVAYGVAYEWVADSQRQRVAKTLRKLARLGVIGYQRGKGRNARCTISIDFGRAKQTEAPRAPVFSRARHAKRGRERPEKWRREHRKRGCKSAHSEK
jgi:hypothetical protein